MSTGMIMDGVLGSEAIDSSGEVLDVKGADISDVDKGTCLLNWEHTPGEKGASTIVGVVLSAKKIYKRSDCETDRQRKYWDEVKLPYIYGVARLYDGAGHEEAKRIAAIVRDHVANKEPIVCRYSVEGATLKKEDNRLAESVVRRVAITVKPCNRTAVSGLIEDPNAPDGFEKTFVKKKMKDLLDFSDTEKSEQDPMFQRLGHALPIICNPVMEDNLAKATEAGVPSAAPSALTGGAALQREDLGKKARSLLRVYRGKKFNRAEFRTMAKTLLPEASEDFLDHFSDMAEDYHVKRSQLAKKEAATPAPSPKPAKVKAAPAPKAAASSKPKAAPAVQPDDNPIKLKVATIRGVPVKPNPHIKPGDWDVDEENGILHTNFGSFPLYNPDVGFKVKEHKTAKAGPFYHNGILHVAPGTDLATVPHNGPNPEFRKMLSSPAVEEFHSGKVMPNYLRVRDLAKSRTLPDEIMAHASAMSMMSPNTPVDVQELMYAKLHDTFEDAGIDMRDPEFSKMRKSFMRRNKAKEYPRLAEEHFRNAPGVHLSTDSEKGGRRKAGEIKSFMLADNKFDNIAKYPKLHPTLVDLLQKHGTDGRAATEELMQHKVQEMQWKAKRYAFRNKMKKQAAESGLNDDFTTYVNQKMAEAEAQGKFQKKGAPPVEREPGADDDDESPLPFDPRMLANQDPDFDPDNFYEHPSIMQNSWARPTGKRWYRSKFKQEARDAGLEDHLSQFVRSNMRKFPEYDGVAVPGLAPKTGRYAFLLAGGSNTIVPDTHMVRHMLGMDADKDGRTLLKLKTGLWNPKRMHVLKKMDNWYKKNHPAVDVMVNHPEWGKHFETPDDAISPAFWRHWAVIAADERARGLDASQAQNEFSTHEPYWLAVDKILKRHGLAKFEEYHAPDHNMIVKTLALHKQYENDYGEIPAMMMYYAHLVPHLLEAGEYRRKHDDMADFAKSINRLSALDIELRKSAADIQVSKLADPKVPTVHKVEYKADGDWHNAGRFALHDGMVHHLEDYHGLLEHLLPEGPLTLQGVSAIHGMKMSPHLRVTIHEMETPEKPEKDPKQELAQAKPPAQRPPSVFEYTRAGMDKPHTIEVHRDGNATIDGNKLSHSELQSILANHNSGAGTIRYKKTSYGSVKKNEEAFFELIKADPEPEFEEDELLQHARAAEAAGHLPAGYSKAFTRHLYEDPMTPGIGNKKAATKFLSKGKPGTYVQMDGNDFSKINNAFGHAQGDAAIKAFGQAARAAMDETVGSENGKLFRNGGDEFVAHVPSHEHAAQFQRALSEKLGKIAPIGGAHKLSMSFGFGPDANTADAALYEAKKQKVISPPAQGGLWSKIGRAFGIGGEKRRYKVGQVPNLAHSLMPGHEGPLPVHDAQAHALHSAINEPQSPVAKPVPVPKQPAPPKIAA